MRLVQWILTKTRDLKRSVVKWPPKYRGWREHRKVVEQVREARGLALLREWLSAEQRAQFEASRCFEVIGCHSRKRYRIYHGIGGNVYELGEDNRPAVSLCFVPDGRLVAGDVMLAQKIALETNESSALEVANKNAVPVLARR